MKKSVVVLFVLAGLFIVCTLPSAASGDWGTLTGGIVIAAVFAFCGYRQHKKPVADKQASKQEYPVFVEDGGKKYHFDLKCSNMKNPKSILKAAAKKKGYSACKKCSVFRFSGTEM